MMMSNVETIEQWYCDSELTNEPPLVRRDPEPVEGQARSEPLGEAEE